MIGNQHGDRQNQYVSKNNEGFKFPDPPVIKEESVLKIYLTEVEYKELLLSYLAAEKIDSLFVERLRTVAPRE